MRDHGGRVSGLSVRSDANRHAGGSFSLVVPG
jgi:hypothetical protein